MLKELKTKADEKVFMKWTIPPSLLTKQINENSKEYIDKDNSDNISLSKLNVEERNGDLNKKNDCTDRNETNLLKKKFSSMENLNQNCKIHEKSYGYPPFVCGDELLYNGQLSRIMSQKAEKYVRKWLTTAHPPERIAALKIIHKLFHETNKQDQYSERQIQELLKNTVKSDWNPSTAPHPIFSRGNGSTHLKHLNLLTQNERRDHWMYCSWHHLPPYTVPKDLVKYDYPGSHYLRLVSRQPKDYVIHPDIG
ncbi:unnamed protein product [Trichobilharzia szidati]|nr:unnamed protein product [Trichobilharzia szidati]